MTIEYKENEARFNDVVGVEEAEALLEWLQGHAGAGLDLSACTHLHPANLQVLMAAGAVVSAWPTQAALASWLKPVLRGL